MRKIEDTFNQIYDDYYAEESTYDEATEDLGIFEKNGSCSNRRNGSGLSRKS
ncbi:MAG: hypothetical protein LUC50_08715 [Ruminococcus sp.]|nr:hypothetical protein [Ruminococcus sp.]